MVGGTGGIGRAVSLELGARSAQVIVHGGSSAQRLEATLGELEKLGAQAEGFLLSLGSGGSSLQSLLEAIAGLGRIDILAVAFGPFVRKSLAATTMAEWEDLALLNLALPGALCSALMPGMASRGWGRILLFGGTRTDGIRAYSSNAAYAAAKTGLAVLAKSLAAEGASKGVACLMACPGFVDTEYLATADRASLRAKAPGGRLSTPEDIASLAVGLLMAEPCLASGAVVSLDGGLALY